LRDMIMSYQRRASPLCVRNEFIVVVCESKSPPNN
jgi:hypothetical protein